MAYVGLITYYAQLGQAPQSLRYYSLYSELEKSTGIVSARPLLKKSLVMDYALLGRFEEMTIELEALDEQNKGLERENNDLYDRLTALQEDFSCLLSQYESQNEQIKTLQAQRDHYRLAFFGLLAIALFALAMWIAYRIVRKKTSK